MSKIDLPEGWMRASVGEIYKIIGGGTPSTKIAGYWNGNIPWITSRDIHGLYSIEIRKKITEEAIENSATNQVPAGSIIVATRVSLGKIAYVKTPLCFSQDSQALVRDGSEVDPHYAVYYLSRAIQIFQHIKRGTTIVGVTKKQLADIPMLIPPLNEQKRIVAKIESILGEIDAIERNVTNMLNHLQTLKRSVLKMAFEGKLVPQNPRDEPADVLIRDLKTRKALNVGARRREKK